MTRLALLFHKAQLRTRVNTRTRIGKNYGGWHFSQASSAAFVARRRTGSDHFLPIPRLCSGDGMKCHVHTIMIQLIKFQEKNECSQNLCHYICKACNKGCERGVTHKCQETCSDSILFRHVRTRTFECRARCVTDILQAARISINRRQTGWKESPYAKRRETAVCNKLVTRIMNVSSRSLRSVNSIEG
jgi:hypothetical protein